MIPIQIAVPGAHPIGICDRRTIEFKSGADVILFFEAQYLFQQPGIYSVFINCTHGQPCFNISHALELEGKKMLLDRLNPAAMDICNGDILAHQRGPEAPFVKYRHEYHLLPERKKTGIFV